LTIDKEIFMKKNLIALLLADGFEEIEALTPLDILRRVGAEVVTVGITGKEVVGAHGIKVAADITYDEAEPSDFNHLILPGGMPGAANLDSHPFTDEILAAVKKNNGCIAAICAAPFILGVRGELKGKRAVCYPGFEDKLLGATVVNAPAVSDGNIVTAKGMGAALPFSYEILKVFLGMDEEKITGLRKTIMELC
jgi:4-methyl-5(b-hydroxyethyl)-thiazole monophosphate biosynthesis